MKYGAELSPVNGNLAPCAGWLTAKSGNQITVDDLIFDETHTLALDVKVYEFNTDTSTPHG